MMTIQNLPSKLSGIKLTCTFTPETDTEDACILVRTKEGWTVCEERGPLSYIVPTIARWMEEARDIGYMQAQDEIRKALGMEK